MTLNEKFEKWRTRTESLPIDERLAFRIFSDGYLDGAKAERDEVTTVIDDALVDFGDENHWPIPIDQYEDHYECNGCVRTELAKEIERRIKAREL